MNVLGFSPLPKDIFGMILISSSIVPIRSLDDAIMNKNSFYLFVMTMFVAATLVGGKLISKYYNLDFIGPPYSMTLTST